MLTLGDTWASLARKGIELKAMMGLVIYPVTKKGWFDLKKNICKCHPKSGDSSSSPADSRVKPMRSGALLAGFRQQLLGKKCSFQIDLK